MSQYELEYVTRTAQTPLTCRIVSMENSSPHWHYEYEAFFVLRGSVTVHCEATTQRLAAGDIFLFNPSEIHSINQPEPNNLCLMLQFSPDIYSDIYNTRFRFELNTCKNISHEAIGIFQQTMAQIGLLLYEKPNGFPFYVRGRLFDFIGAMFKYLKYQVGQELEQPVDLEDFDRIKLYIKQRFAEDISQTQMCRDLGLSRATLHRQLKKAGASSYKVLVNYYRVEHAKSMLRTTTSAIPYIASESGFASESSFYRVFKELTSVSPSQYRESPQIKPSSLGIQGYLGYSESEAVALLREICAR
ncbi:MAG: AraC family transcriptional regulator [Oscillospiraceae bacterium]|nr:AraC family transcriptional regulator [Oscillospiraceae bacterium]MCL2280220.1 AraC family transcriptional regulator [Oscillospiraceae bacterium]